MTTETQQPADGGVATSADTLTVTDNRTGRQYEIPIEDGTIRATELRKIKTDDDDFGLMTYDPAYMATASCRSAITFIDGEQGDPRVPRLSDRAAGREVDLSRSRIPADPRRSPDHKQLEDWDQRDHDPHVRARERQGVHAGLPLRRAPDGDAAGVGRRAVDLLPRGERDQGQRGPLPAGDPAAREDADAGRVLLPPQPRHAVCLSGQRPQLPRATSSR